MKHLMLLLAILLANDIWSQHTNGSFQLTLGAVSPLSVSLPGDAGIPSGNLAVGSSGFGRINRRVLIGGDGFGTIKNSVTSNNTRVSSDWGMGFGNIGYILVDKNRWHHHIFAGLGGGGLDVRYENNSEQSIRLADNLILDPGQRVRISSGGFAWQAGISLNRLMFDPAVGKGGLKIGLDMGVYHFPVAARWQNINTETQLTGISRPSLQGAFVRMTIGGMW